jgi:hypothetical protein
LVPDYEINNGRYANSNLGMTIWAESIDSVTTCNARGRDDIFKWKRLGPV